MKLMYLLFKERFRKGVSKLVKSYLKLKSAFVLQSTYSFLKRRHTILYLNCNSRLKSTTV